MFQLQMTVPGHVYIDHLNIRFRPAHVILPRQGTTDFPVTAFIVDSIDRKRRLLFLIEELEQLPVPHEMWAEKLGDETFVTIVRPYVLNHNVGLARSSDIREPHPGVGCGGKADAAVVLNAAKAKRTRFEPANLSGRAHGEQGNME